jgi:nucleoside 2-deoxyribosyltransferase
MPPEARRAAMFELDVAKVIACDVLLIVLDGRVPDEGACFELGVAYAEKRRAQPRKRLIGLQTDVRAAFLGAKLNPMLAVSLDVVVTDEAALVEVLRTPAAP